MNECTDALREVIDAGRIARRIGELARDIDRCYGEEPLVLVCVLKGAYMFFTDLSRALRKPNVQVDFIRISSYGMGQESTRTVTISKDVEVPLQGRHVLVVEDIVDTGLSMRFLLNHLSGHDAKSLRVAVLLDKGERRELPINLDFVGFAVPSGFLVGYGLDCAERYRNLPSIHEVLKP